MELLNLPAEVIHMIISQCDLPALLQLRLVSKHIKIYVDTSTRFPEALETIQFNIELPYLITFVETAPCLPFTNFWCEHYPILSSCRNFKFTENENSALRKFAELFCPNIRKLEVKTFCGCHQEPEFDLFQFSKDIRELTIRLLHVNSTRDSHGWYPSEDTISLTRLPFKEPNLSIKKLVVEEEEACGKYLIELMKICPSIEVTQLTKGIDSDIIESDPFRLEQVVYPYLLRSRSEGHLKQLKRINFNNKTIQMDFCSPDEILFFQKLVSNKKLRLENVSSPSLYKILNCSALSIAAKTEFKARIVSFNAMSEILEEADFCNLQELDFNSSVLWPPEGGRLALISGTLLLPKLRKLRADISNETNSANGSVEFVKSLFYPEQQRTTVTNLTILYYNKRDIPSVTILPTTMFDAFPNLSYLQLLLVGDDFSITELCELIKAICGKPLLEELVLSCSKGIPEAAFFGDVQAESPIFLKLKNLKRFTLYSGGMHHNPKHRPRKGVHRMGNRIMKLISKMDLTYLCISGESWNYVTGGGIKKLVQGPFGRSVVYAELKFPNTGYQGNLDKRSGSLRRLARIVHNNRKAKGLTFRSFEKFDKSSDDKSFR